MQTVDNDDDISSMNRQTLMAKLKDARKAIRQLLLEPPYPLPPPPAPVPEPQVDWSAVPPGTPPPSDAVVMDPSLGDLTPAYAQRYIATNGIDAARAKYAGREHFLPSHISHELGGGK